MFGYLSMNNFINMNKGQLKNLEDGNGNGDALNVKQLNEVNTNASYNYAYFLSLYNYNIKNELRVLIIKDLYFSDSRQIKTANTYLLS